MQVNCGKIQALCEAAQAYLEVDCCLYNPTDVCGELAEDGKHPQNGEQIAVATETPRVVSRRP